MKFSLKLALVAMLLAALVVSTAMARKYNKRSHDDVWLGITNTSVDDRLVDKYDLGTDYGAFVLRISDDSPAEEAGLEKRDVIIAVNGEKVYDSDDLSDLLEDFEVDEDIEITIMRDNATQTITATLDEAPYRSNRFTYSRSPNIRFLGGRHHGSDSYVGIQLDNLTRQLGEYFGIKRGRGALIAEVEEDSPAADAGLQAGDVIIAIDGHTVRETEDVVDDVQDAEVGDKLEFKIIRDRQEVTIEVEVGERDGDYLGYEDDDFEWRGFEGLKGLQGLAGLAGLQGLAGLAALEDLEDIYYIDGHNSPGIHFYDNDDHDTWHHTWGDDDFDFDFNFDFDMQDFEIDMEDFEADMREMEEDMREMEAEFGSGLKDLRFHYD
jgi:membrane-associated protease RseP (regulator of RpoE activity)